MAVNTAGQHKEVVSRPWRARKVSSLGSLRLVAPQPRSFLDLWLGMSGRRGEASRMRAGHLRGALSPHATQRNMDISPSYARRRRVCYGSRPSFWASGRAQ